MSSPEPPKTTANAVLTDDDASVRRRAGGSSSSGDADQVLEALGYKPELSRNRSTLQVAFMLAVLAAVPYGMTTTMTYPVVGGGPVVMIWGWVAVSLIVLCVAASLGEITSVYPTAGGKASPSLPLDCENGEEETTYLSEERLMLWKGVYYQTFMLAPASWRRLASWICGWLYVVGQITIALAVNFGTTQFFVACVNIFEKDDGSPIWDATDYQIFLIFLGITIACNLVASLGNRWLPLLDVSFRRQNPRAAALSSRRPRVPSVLTTFRLDCRYHLDPRRCGGHRGWCASRR